ncbi:hypothetical protein KQX54_004116 [Cotesia glomerata]|uniref:Uncharacterized protein n=1 Tax=Cotesia glomerata TaxID=32391 RepID=A0AAV7IT91_COTGL|nr:hypothetical protein KQX54_004116 [Cotesia glomerata]
MPVTRKDLVTNANRNLQSSQGVLSGIPNTSSQHTVSFALTGKAKLPVAVKGLENNTSSQGVPPCASEYNSLVLNLQSSQGVLSGIPNTSSQHTVSFALTGKAKLPVAIKDFQNRIVEHTRDRIEETYQTQQA